MRYLVLGAGKIGKAVVYDLCRNSREAQLIVVDSQAARLEEVAREFPDERISVIKADLSDLEEISYILSSADIVISCAAAGLNYRLAKAAIEAGASYCDLGGNDEVMQKQFLLDAMAQEKNVALIAGCGLAPGLVSLLAARVLEELDTVDELHIRVGALPLEPRPPLNYALSFSIDGLLYEYAEDATIIVDGKTSRVPSLSELEELEFPPPFAKLEAFYTGGGLSTLAESYSGKVKNLSLKTIRFPGHCQQMKLLKDLGFMDEQPLWRQLPLLTPRSVLAQILDRKLPNGEPDAVLVRVTACGKKNEEERELIYELVDYMDEEKNLSAMMRCSAYPISIIAQMLGSGQIRQRGSLYLERHVLPSLFFAELERRGISIKRQEKLLSLKAE